MSKTLVVRFSDDTLWGIDTKIIAHERAAYYAEHDCLINKSLDYKTVYEHELSVQDDADLLEWASNNMNWSDVHDHAQLLEIDEFEPDYDHEWSNAEKSIR